MKDVRMPGNPLGEGVQTGLGSLSTNATGMLEVGQKMQTMSLEAAHKYVRALIADGYYSRRQRQEIMAAYAGHVRRSGGSAPREEPKNELVGGSIRLDLDARNAYRGAELVDLTAKEFDLLELLMRNSKIILTKEQILLKVWGYDSDAEDNNAEVYISFLRRKLAHLHSTVKIKTIRLVGYCLEVEQ